MQHTGNTILITGGGSGIGRALAEASQAQGNTVIISGRREEMLRETAAANPGMETLRLDIEDVGSIQPFADKIAAQYPALNVVVHNAGIMRPENILEGKLADAEAMIATNLLGPMRLTAALLPHLRKQPNAAIVTVSSGLAFVPMAMTPTYCATKAAIHSWTQSLRYQLRETNIHVIELVPPYVQTELMGTRQLSDPAAMPLQDFITETMALLNAQPDAHEVLVERVKPLRFAEKGDYDAFFQTLNDRISKEMH